MHQSVFTILFHFREMYRVTEGLQREKQSLMKQLDLLRYNENISWEHEHIKPAELLLLIFLASGSVLIGIPVKSGCKVKAWCAFHARMRPLPRQVLSLSLISFF